MPIARVLEKLKTSSGRERWYSRYCANHYHRLLLPGSYRYWQPGRGGLMEWVNAHNNILTFPTYFTTNVMSLYAALYIANSLAKRYKLKNSLIGASAILVHLLLSVTVTEDGTWMVT